MDPSPVSPISLELQLKAAYRSIGILDFRLQYQDYDDRRLAGELPETILSHLTRKAIP